MPDEVISRRIDALHGHVDHFARRLRLLYHLATTRDYTEGYARFMDARVKSEPEAAVGGFDGTGRQQFDYLCEHGLSAEDRVLEIGSGIFRAGQHFIGYLEPGHYVGLEISQDTIEAGFERLSDDLVAEKRPTVYNNDDLRFEDLDEPVDYVLAHSVFTHAPADVVKECFAHVGRVMYDDAQFFFTFFDADDVDFGVFEPGGFAYTADELVEFGRDHGLRVTIPDDSYCSDSRHTLARITTD